MSTYEKLAAITDSSIGGEYHRAYNYDYKGREIQRVECDFEGNILRTTSRYDLIGNLLAQRESYTHDGTTDVLDRTFEYDSRSRMTKETAQFNDGEQAAVAYTYDDLGQLTGKTYGTGAHAIHETMDYNIQGWLTRKNSELFHMELRYFDAYREVLKPSYTGNIVNWQWSHWQINGNTYGDDCEYGFHYDDLSRLTAAQQFWSDSEGPEDSFTEKGITYDKNGNILTLNRTGTSEDARSYRFSYDGNLRVKEINSNSAYGYDANGNISSDALSGLEISYNFLNLPSKMYGWGDYSDYYEYLADGTKILHEYKDGQQDEYRGSLVYYSNGEFSVPFGGGRIVGTNNGANSEVHYFLTDHLGSTRVVAKVTQTGRIDLDRKDYYPFGKEWTQAGMPTSSNRYMFSGKERQDIESDDCVTTPLYDFGARFYDPDGVTFIQQDPLMEKYYSIGQYNYCAGNPVNSIDPDGKIVIPVGSKEYVDHFYSNIKYMQSKGTAGGYNILHKSENIYFVIEGESKIKVSNTGVNTIYWKPDVALLTTNNKILSPATILAHEFEHGVDAETDMNQYLKNGETADEQYGDKNERKLITEEEQEIAKRHGEIEEGEVTRQDHKGFHVQVQYTDPKEIEKFIQNYNTHYNENQQNSNRRF